MRPLMLLPFAFAMASMACLGPEIYLVPAAPAVAEVRDLRLRPQVLDPYQVQSIFGGTSGSRAAYGNLLVLNLEIENLGSSTRLLERSMFRLLNPDGRSVKPRSIHDIAVGSGGPPPMPLIRSYELHKTLKGWMDKTCEVPAGGRTRYLMAFVANDATPGTWILELNDATRGSGAPHRVPLPLVTHARGLREVAPKAGN